MRYILFITALLALGACKRPPISTLPAELPAEITKNEATPNGAPASRKGFSYLKASCKVDLKDAQNNVSFRVNLRMHKDSAIWVRFSKLGFEGARVLITRDSVRIINHQDNSYTAAKFDTLTKILNFRLDFEMLQAVLLANMPIPEYEPTASQPENNLLKITQERDGIAILNLLNNDTQKLQQLQLKDIRTNNLLRLLYQNFQDHGGNLFATTNQATITFWNKNTKQNEISDIKMEYNEVKFSHHAIEFPFQAPEKYKRK